MLSIDNVSPQQGANYFKEDNYYSKAEAESQSKWFGSGAEALGLAGKVDSASFQNLLEGKSPDGRKLLRGKKVDPKKHRAGFDLTFSAPKSVSMAVLMGGDRQLEQAHRIAVERTLKIIEQQYTQARVWDGQQQQKINTGNLIVAQFHHTTSREKDPQLHTHCVLLNSTQLTDGKWRALTNEELYNQKMLLGAIYRNELAYEARKLGYEIEPRPDELFEIKGYTQFQLDWFSKRRQQILELVGADASAVAKQWAALQTRAKKGKELPREEQVGWWQAQNEAFNLQIKHPVPQPVAQVEDTTAAATTAVKEAIEHCSERTVAFKRRMLEKFVFNQIKQFSYAELEEALANEPELLPTFDQRFTTQAAVNRELETIRLMQQGQGQVKAIATADTVNHYLENKTLTAGQGQAISVAATTTNQFIGWQGVAGAGKTYALNSFREIAQTQGYVLKGYAPSSEAAKVLGEEVGIESTTVASLIQTRQPEEIPPNQIWIVDEAGLLGAKDAHALLQRATEQKARVILVGDPRQLSAVEAGNPFKSLQQAGIQTAHLNQSLRQRTLDLQAAVDLIAAGEVQQGIEKLNTHNRIAVIPDSQQRLKQLVADYMAVAPEGREKTLVLAGTNAERLQITQLLRAALKIEQLLGKTATLTQLKPKDLTQVQARYTHHYAVGDVVVPTREYKRLGLSKFQPYAVTAIERNHLTLQAVDGTCSTVDPMAFRKTVYTPQAIEIAVGDRLKWTRNNQPLGQRNGQEFKVTAIDNNHAQIQYKNSLTDSIDLSKFNHLDYALVSTTYSSQGKTAERVLIAADQTLGKESFYVATSRAKYDLKIYAEDEAALLKLAQKSKAKENPMELIKPQRTKLAVSTTSTTDTATPISPPTIEEAITYGSTDGPTEPTASTAQLESGDGEAAGRRIVLRLDAHSRAARPDRILGERPTTNQPRTVKPSPRTNQPATSRPRPRLATSSDRTRRGGRCYDQISRPTRAVGARPQPTTNSVDRMVKRVSSQSSTAATVSDSGTEVRQHHAELQPFDANVNTLVKRLESSSGTDATVTEAGAVTPEPIFRAGQSNQESNPELQQFSDSVNPYLQGFESAVRDIAAVGAGAPSTSSATVQSNQLLERENWQSAAGVEPVAHSLNAVVEELEAAGRAGELYRTTTQPAMGATEPSLRQPTAGNGSHLEQLGRVSRQLGEFGTSLAGISKQQHSLAEIAARLGLEPEPNHPGRWQRAGFVVDIEGERFYNPSSRRGGGSIALIVQMRHCSYGQAINWLKQGAPAVKRTEQTTQPAQPQPPAPSFTPPVADEQQWSQVRRYLIEQRHLIAQLVEQLHEAGKVYADNAGNAVFLQVASQGRITRANLLSTNSNRSLTQVAPGSLSGDGWFQFSQGSGKLARIVLTDSPVKAISLAALEQQQERTVYISVDPTQNLPALRSFATQGVRVEVAFAADLIGERKARQALNTVPGAVKHKSSVAKSENRQTATQIKLNEATQKQPRLTLQARMLQAIQHDRSQYKRQSQSDLKLVVLGLVAGRSFQQIKDDIAQHSALVQHWKKNDDCATAVNKTVKYTQQLCEEAPTQPVYYQQLYKKYVSDIQNEKGYLQPTQMDQEVALAALKSYPEDTVRSVLKHSLSGRVHGEDYVQQTLEQAQRLQLEAQVKPPQPQHQESKGFELGD